MVIVVHSYITKPCTMLSSNSIIHFTNSKENLKSILKENFRIYYCYETIEINSDFDFNVAIPMVSFCDIPLSQIKQHITKYGAYGIGLTKQWASTQKLNPVLYVEPNSNLTQSYLTVLQHMLGEKRMDELNEQDKALVDIVRYMKNYEGKLVRGGNVEEHYRYSDEREWRYVMDIKEKVEFIIGKDYYSTEEQKTTANNSLNTHRLEFTPNDIKYIIIQQDAEIGEFLEVLREAKGKTYAYADVERLMTRIITTEQIVTDF